MAHIKKKFSKEFETKIIRKDEISFKGRDGETVSYVEVWLYLGDDFVCARDAKGQFDQYEVGDVVIVDASFLGRRRVFADFISVQEVLGKAE